MNLYCKKVLLVMIVILFFTSKIHPGLNINLSDSMELKSGALFRIYLFNDQRIQWSGVETTFGSEALISADIHKKTEKGKLKVESEFLINQPYGENILKDEYRIKYHPNFKIDPFRISKLNLQYHTGKIILKIGKGETPFGKTYFQIFSNDFNFGNPFIRTEAILWRETGIFFTFKPGSFRLDLAVTNGEEDKDTNSSKAGILRIGLEGKNSAIGASIKAQDGIGSEQQKQYNNHIGIDFMLRLSVFRISGEIIYDQYGFHKYIHDDDIFWERSLYYRDIFYKHKTPLTGIGGYIDFGYKKSKFYINLNIGYYKPKEIGNPLHDDPITRIILKVKYLLLNRFDAYGLVFFENNRTEESWSSGARSYAFLAGFCYTI